MTSRDGSRSNLQDLYEREVSKTESLQHEVSRLNGLLVELAAKTEVEEDYITNKLSKQLSALKKEKEKIAIETEREEEFLTNKLSKKIEDLLQEKEQMEIETSKRAAAQQKQIVEFIAKFERSLETCTSSCPCTSLLDEIKDVAKSFGR